MGTERLELDSGEREIASVPTIDRNSRVDLRVRWSGSITSSHDHFADAAEQRAFVLAAASSASC